MRLPRLGLPAVLTVLLLVGFACTGTLEERPRLVVFLVVDQLRGDLLERYDSLFSGGIRRLHDGGFRFLSATHDHAKTSTAVGHATLSTGVFPSRNGIVGNEWLERTPDGWRSVYSVEDTLTHILGLPVLEGRSPQNLLRGGLADWIMAADSGAVVVSASRKDRAAITMAGKTRGHVFWITENEGRFATSTFYAADYPAWVERINRLEMPSIFADSIWEQTVPLQVRSASRPDTSEYEGDGVHTFFPHRFYEEVGSPDRTGALTRWAFGKVHPDAALGVFAMEAVRSLGLGGDQTTDYLAISFSQTDAVGHDYGPRSREQLVNLLHLDGVLGEVMATLDEYVGEGRWVMALTGDHGVLDLPEHVVGGGSVGRRATREEFAQIRSTFRAWQGENGGSPGASDSLVAALEQLAFVEDAMTVLELSAPPPADSFSVLLRNSFHPDRWIGGFGSQGSGVVFRFREGYYASTSQRGTGHGSPYYYDRHVPLIFFGAGVEKGISMDPVRTVDIAPTLALLAGIDTPDDLDGQPLLR